MTLMIAIMVATSRATLLMDFRLPASTNVLRSCYTISLYPVRYVAYGHSAWAFQSGRSTQDIQDGTTQDFVYV